ncbi:MAG: hypothetical protein ACHP83_16735 [Burkholderiales bacterium]
MDIKLQLLESFHAHGSDGQTYKVFGYERLARDESVPVALEQWQSTGTSEYRLADGRFVDERDDGSLLIEGSDVTLTRACALCGPRRRLCTRESSWWPAA